MADEADHDLARRGWDALAAADWELARSCFEQAREFERERRGARRARPSRSTSRGSTTRAIELTERAFAPTGSRACRSRRPIARAGSRSCTARSRATWPPPAAGWRAPRACSRGWTSAPAHGWLTLDLGVLHRRCGGARAARARRRSRSPAGTATSTSSSTRSPCWARPTWPSGRVAEGMKLLDEAMTAVSAGEVAGVVSIGDIYCRLLSACEIALDVSRAEEWMAVAGRFDAWSDFVSPVCRDPLRRHPDRGRTLGGGRGGAARRVCAASRPATARCGSRRSSSSPISACARGVSTRRGACSRATSRTRSRGESWRRSRSAQGELALAEDLVQPLPRGRGPVRSRPARRLLELLVQIRLARDDLAGASEALERLTGSPPSPRTSGRAAFAELAAGRVRSPRRRTSGPRRISRRRS